MRESNNRTGARTKKSNNTLKLLVIGDIFGKSGRRAINTHLSDFKKRHGVDGVIANAENASGGIGLTPGVADELFQAGIDLITTGNHVWKHKDIVEYMGLQPRILRPENYPPGTPGQGFASFQIGNGARVGVLNLMGRIFMEPLDCPFRTADRVLKRLQDNQGLEALIVDMHAEASSEKMAMGFHLDGRVSAVLGTHTHIPTADHRILPRGTGYQTDIGMTGCYRSIIGMRIDSVMPRFLNQRPHRFEPEVGEGMLCGALVTVNRENRLCRALQPVRLGAGLSPSDPGGAEKFPR